MQDPYDDRDDREPPPWARWPGAGPRNPLLRWLFGPIRLWGGRVQLYGCSPGCLLFWVLISVVLTLVLNLLLHWLQHLL